MPREYRFCLFEDHGIHATALLVLHCVSDEEASEEAVVFLSASVQARIEVWQGTRRVCRLGRPLVAPHIGPPTGIGEPAPRVCGL